MSALCPEGHLSESLDYCDVCGSPMAAAPGTGSDDALRPRPDESSTAPEEPQGKEVAPEAATQTCPHCGAVNVADALFCETCGYDFTTGTPPMGSEPEPEEEAQPEEEPETEKEPETQDEPDPDEEAQPEEEPGPEDGYADAPDQDGAHAVTDDEPAAPAEDTPEPDPGPEPDPDPQAVPEPQPVPAPRPDAAAERPDPDPPSQQQVSGHRKARHTPPSRALAEAWVAEVWVDPDWYAVQQTEEACPSPGVPDIVPLTRSTALIGRPSGSLGLRPEIDAGADSAVSRRHAQLTSDGKRWWVEDLGSSNGTFVGTVGEPLPTDPITPGQRVEIDRDDRLYVGAWTRIVLRQATESERQGTG